MSGSSVYMSLCSAVLSATQRRQAVLLMHLLIWTGRGWLASISIGVRLQVSIEGLRSVPLDILKRLDIVPAAYLQELGDDHDLFAELPVAVQRQARLLGNAQARSCSSSNSKKSGKHECERQLLHQDQGPTA